MKNKLLLTVSSLCLVMCLEIQSVQAMDEDNTLKEGYYTLKNRCFADGNNAQKGLLTVAKGKSRAGAEENYFKDNEASPSGQHAQILVDNFDYNNYLPGATQRNEVLWYIKPQDNAYIIQNVAYSTSASFSGLLSRSDSKLSPSGSYVQVLKEGSYEGWKNHYLHGGDQRNNILWNIVKAEDNTHKVQSLSLKHHGTEYYNQGWLDYVLHQSSNGRYVQALHTSQHPANYFLDKDTTERGPWRNGILWELSPVTKEESDKIWKARYSSLLKAEKIDVSSNKLFYKCQNEKIEVQFDTRHHDRIRNAVYQRSSEQIQVLDIQMLFEYISKRDHNLI